MNIWPVTLPQKLFQDGYTDSEPELTLIDQSEQGPPAMRKICSYNARLFEGTMNLTVAQKIILSAFYRANCHAVFSFLHPYTEVPIAVRFTEKPAYASAVGGMYRKVTLKFEEL